ncbi:MAG: hypothetical protein KC553_04380 [Nitrospina sp.]|nr:hypothetical protein [Nitrospina sp.]
MTLEFFRALTPFITLGLMLGLGLVGWILRRSLEVTESRLRELKSDLMSRLDKQDIALEKLETARLQDQRNLYEQFVNREWFSVFTGNSEMTLVRIERQLQTLNRKFNGLLVRYKKTG